MVRLGLAWFSLVVTAVLWPQNRSAPSNFTRPEIFDTRPIALDPAHFQLVFENQHVQVIRVHLGPHEKSRTMEIPAHVMTCLTDQRVRVIYAHAKAAERSQKAGYSSWVERDEYRLENLEDKALEWVIVVPEGEEKPA
jgi:hypothetical protein